MSYISLIVPAFHINKKDPNEIQKYCCSQFNTSKDNLNLIEFKKDKFEDKTHHGIIFNESNLSLNKIEQLIYERNCFQNLSDKTCGSLELITKKIKDLEYLINSLKEESKNFEKKLYKKKFFEEEKNNNSSEKKIEIEKRQIEYSEKALNKIKFEFNNMVEEIQFLNKKVNNKKYMQKDIIIGSLNIDRCVEDDNDEGQNLYFDKCV